MGRINMIPETLLNIGADWICQLGIIHGGPEFERGSFFPGLSWL